MDIPIDSIPESLSEITDLKAFKADIKAIMLYEIENFNFSNIYFCMQLFSNINVYPKRNTDFNLKAFISDYLITGNRVVNLFQSYLRNFIPGYSVITDSCQTAVIDVILLYS